MPELAGWGGEWLPPRIARAIAAEDAREAAESRRAEAQREVQLEQRRNDNLALYKMQADARGEAVSALALASGQVAGRPIGDVLADAVAAADRDDAREAARIRREGTGPPVHVDFGEPIIHTAARGETGLAIFNRARRFADRVRARKALEAAEMAEAINIPLERPVTLQQRREGDDVVYLGTTR